MIFLSFGPKYTILLRLLGSPWGHRQDAGPEEEKIRDNLFKVSCKNFNLNQRLKWSPFDSPGRENGESAQLINFEACSGNNPRAANSDLTTDSASTICSTVARS